MKNKKRFAIIVNPKAGRGSTLKLLPYLKELIVRLESKFDFFMTERPLHAAAITEKIHKDYDGIVAFGGDGTANEIMNGLAGTNTPLGIIPIGTGNDFARSINVPRRLEKALRILQDYKTKLIDLGVIGERVFLNGVGIGFDGYVNFKSKTVKFLKGSLSYLYSIFASLAAWKAIPMRIEVDGKPFPHKKAFLFAVGNGSFVGGGLKLTPQAQLDDAKFDICHIREVPILKILYNFGRLKTGTIAEVPEVTIGKAQKILVNSDYYLPAHFDGELYQPLTRELKIEIVPQSAFVIGQW